MSDQLNFEDTNIWRIGTDIDHKVKYNSAATEPAWNNTQIGPQPGLWIWRIEDFHVVPWPTQLYGQFYDGDSYIVLHSYIIPRAGNQPERLAHDIFFWLGAKTTQDEAGTAAYKTVELDEYLHGIATQHRETQLHPSEEFLSLFPRLSIRKGGVRSGFHHVETEQQLTGHTTLLRIFTQPTAAAHGHSVVVHEVEPTWKSLDDADVFVLEKDNKIWVWQGKDSSPMEKAKAAQVVSDLTLAKHIDVEVLSQTEARAKIVVDLLGGGDAAQSSYRTGRPIRGAAPSAAARPPRLLRIVFDESGRFQFKLDKECDSIRVSDLDSNDIFIFDTGKKIWVWEGQNTSPEVRDAWKSCTGAYLRYLQQESQAPDVIAATPVAKVVEGFENAAFFKSISVY
uniref:Severin n=1 Tax=Talaromyces marneffei PM1 TaxID=1077442 RepID=A0A093VMZ3_TALMA